MEKIQETAARRELREETGLAADVLQPIFTDLSQDSIYMGYLCFISAKKDSVVLQPGETVEYLWADKEEFIEIYNSKEYVPPLRKRLRETVGRLFRRKCRQNKMFKDREMIQY